MAATSTKLGFTLLELMVVVAIVGILTALLVPDASRQVSHAKRAQALAQLLSLQLAQEHHYLVYGYYADLAVLGAAPDNPNYRFHIDDITATGYRLVATARDGHDPECAELTLTHLDEKAPAQCWR